MSNYLEKMRGASDVSRRSFIKASAAAAAITAAGMAGCSNNVHETQGEKDGEESVATRLNIVVENGEWVPVACWHNCGGRCLNYAYVVDGVALRQKTDDRHPDSWEYPQLRGCLKGRSQRKHVFGADRLKYPMKRKGWSPEEPNGHLRGVDEWERISWDEAIDYVAAEIKKAYEKYGMRSVFGYDSAATGTINRVFQHLGGYACVSDSSSFGTYSINCNKFGMPTYDCSPTMNYGYSINDRLDTKNADWLVIQGGNPSWASGAAGSYRYLQAKKDGVQFVVIGPSNNVSAQLLDARWIQVRCGTDMAFMIATAYEMLKLDEERGNVIDWDFLHKYCVGFDSESMPDEAKTSENFKGYLLGEYDGVPKTAEWASPICGTPAEDIRWYAELLQKDNKVMLQHSYAFARANGAEDVPQMFMTLGAMGGHMGKSGHCCGGTYHIAGGDGGTPIVTPGGATGLPKIPVTVDDAIPAPHLWDSIMEGHYRYTGNIVLGQHVPAEERDIDIHLVFFGKTSRLQTNPGIMQGIKALRTMDFVFAVQLFYTPQAQYSDIVLPAITPWERAGTLGHHNAWFTGGRESLFVWRQVCEPLYEAKSDQEIGELIAAAMGLPVEEIYPISEKQQFMNQLLGATLLEPNGEVVPLVSITQAELDEWGCTNEPQEGKVAFQQIMAEGCYQVERSEGDAYTYIAYKDFVDDPEANPLPSNSGKFEIYCQWKADTLASFGYPNCEKYKPYPTYIAPYEGYETTFSDFDKGVKGDYPFLVYNPHTFHRGHTVFDNVGPVREAYPNPVSISRADAEAKGIVTGDTVCVSSPYGKVLRTACVLDSIMEGMVSLPHGAWVDLDENEEYCRAGADNVLFNSVPSGSAVTGYNNANVNIEKYDGEPLPLDCKLPARIVEL